LNKEESKEELMIKALDKIYKLDSIFPKDYKMIAAHTLDLVNPWLKDGKMEKEMGRKE